MLALFRSRFECLFSMTFTTGEILATGQPVDPEDVMKLLFTVTLPVSIFTVDSKFQVGRCRLTQ